MIDKILENIDKRIHNNTSVDSSLQTYSHGKVLSVYDGVVISSGLSGCMYGEVVEIKNEEQETLTGIAINLEEDTVGIICLGDYKKVKIGNSTNTTGKIFSVGIGKQVLGRVVDAIGNPIDGKGSIEYSDYAPIEKIAPGVITRKAVTVPLQTGIKAIDSMIAIGRGQRELIIGDRSTGKTQIALDIIANQKKEAERTGNPPVYCIYCAIGQKQSKVAQIVDKLDKMGALEFTVIVNASASDPITMQYIAPYSACSIGEYFRDNNMDALIIYDDLTKHAWSYRQISLILKRPSGREAYPGDIFYLHSRLLERSARLNENYGGGSLTALPIIETQAGDISAYIPTNLISITDGQIFLDKDLFSLGLRPAINTGSSVSRVGGDAQAKAMKQVAGKLKLDMAQYRDLAAFSQFASDLDKTTKDKLNRGARLTEILKQDIFACKSLAHEVLIFYAGINGWLDNIDLNKIAEFEEKFIDFAETTNSDLVKEITTLKDISTLKVKIDDILKKFMESYG